MGEEEIARTTRLLRRMGVGDRQAANDLLEIVYAELHAMARRRMTLQPGNHTLQTTALVHEAWMRLAGPEGRSWDDRAHFFSTAAAAMRSVLVDHARSRNAVKRGGEWSLVELEEDQFAVEDDPDFLLALDESIARLSELDTQLGRLAELRCFGGLATQDVARVLGVSGRTVERGWRTARAWLQRELEEREPPG